MIDAVAKAPYETYDQTRESLGISGTYEEAVGDQAAPGAVEAQQQVNENAPIDPGKMAELKAKVDGTLFLPEGEAVGNFQLRTLTKTLIEKGIIKTPEELDAYTQRMAVDIEKATGMIDQLYGDADHKTKPSLVNVLIGSTSDNPYLQQFIDEQRREKESQGEAVTEADARTEAALKVQEARLRATAEVVFAEAMRRDPEQMKMLEQYAEDERAVHFQELVKQKVDQWIADFTEVGSPEKNLAALKQMIEASKYQKAPAETQPAADATATEATTEGTENATTKFAAETTPKQSTGEKALEAFAQWGLEGLAQSDMVTLLSNFVSFQTGSAYSESRHKPEQKGERFGLGEFKTAMKETCKGNEDQLVEMYGRLFNKLKEKLEKSEGGFEEIEVKLEADWESEEFTPEKVAKKAKAIFQAIDISKNERKGAKLNHVFQHLADDAQGVDGQLMEFTKAFGDKHYVDAEIINFFNILGRGPKDLQINIH